MKKYSVLFIFLLILANSINNITAQVVKSDFIKSDSIGFLKVTGNIVQNNKPLENSIITVYENKNKINQVNTGVDGKFNVRLEFGKQYMIEVSKPGLVVKKFEFDTNLPESANKHMIYKFLFPEIVLFSTQKMINMSILEKPMAIISYSKKHEDFFYDFAYAKSMNEKAEEIQKKINNLESKYVKFIEDGDKNYNIKQYTKARKYYQKALKLKPENTYPNERIIEINKIMKK